MSCSEQDTLQTAIAMIELALLESRRIALHNEMTKPLHGTQYQLDED